MQILKRFFLCGSIISSIFVLPKKNFITPIHRGISAISSKFLPSKIYANMYTRSIFQIIFFKKSVILPIKGRQRCRKHGKMRHAPNIFFMIFILMITQMAHSISDNFKNREICGEILKVKCVKY